MELMTLAIIVIVFCLSIKYLLSKNKYQNLPPKPWDIPLLGSLLFLKPTLYLALERVGQKLGPVFRINLGLQETFVLNSYEAVKEALITQGQIFAGRSKSSFTHSYVKTQGILRTDGENWKRQRRSALQILKDFGFGRDGSKEIIQNEIEDAIKILDAKGGEPVVTQHFFGDCTANVITGISLNERPARFEEEFQTVLKCFDELVMLTIFDMLPLYFPFLLKLPILSTFIMSRNKKTEYTAVVYKYIKKKLLSHKENFDPEQEPKDFIDAMLVLEKEAELSEPDYSAEMYEFRIIRTVHELFVAGNDTTATTLTWMFLLLALHPEILSKVQNEIDEMCDKKVPIKMEVKKSLPYTCAMIDEVTRIAAILPVSLPHRATRDAKILGFDIPQNSIVYPNIYNVHHDASYWERPNEFYPQHFLSADGKSYTPRDHLIPFSMGPRTCMGEILATMELFLISSSIIREFNVKLDGHYSKEEIRKLLIGKDGTIRRLDHHKLVFSRRK